jgi:hypothetical protein
MPVLAKRAAEVTTNETCRENLRTGPEVVKGFFFDGVCGKTGDESIKGELWFPTPVIPDPAAPAYFTGR